jgi:murein DD-endopeptidase MepM/ murein hydrolase activator NlpD
MERSKKASRNKGLTHAFETAYGTATSTSRTDPVTPPAPELQPRRPHQAIRRGEAVAERTQLLRREHWAAASLFGSAALLVALIAPGFAGASLQSAEPPRVSLALDVPPPATLDSEPVEQPMHAAADWQVVTVRNGQTLAAIAANLGMSRQDLHRVLMHPGARDPLSRIRVGDEFAFQIDDGRLQAIRFDRDESNRVVLRLSDEEIVEEVQQRMVQRRVQLASGEITDSLYGAAERAGMSSAATLELAKAFGYDIDFAQDLRVGDQFHVVYEEIWRDGERLRQGDVLAATFVNQGKRYQVFRYEFADGRTEYYDAEGRPTKKSFLRMPIDFARISSRFSAARKHPVLGTTRAHKGVDYAAATGTPIMAAGEGKITYAGWKGGYGRTIIVDHGNGVTTLYAHMSRMGNYKTGSRVRQGAVLGFVGASGLATGPHLHYEFRVAGVHRDPLKVTLPKPQPLPAGELARFRMQTQPMLAQLSLLEGGTAYAAR